jgi:single-strand DNA-binding protein
MAGDTVITIIGNLTADPELRFTPSGAAVANFTVASTPRTFDRQSNEWKDGETLFMRCSVWRDAAENVAESLQRGMRVIVAGRLKSRSYETKEGEKRTVVEMDVDEIGPSLRSATAKVNKTQRGGGGGGGFGGGQQQGGGGWSGGSQSDDPWATGPSAAPAGGGQQQAAGNQGGWGAPSQAPQGGQQGGQQGGWGGGAPSYDEPPF